MGRKSEYKVEKTEKEIADEVKEKLYKEVISADEMASYLSIYSRNHIHFDGRKIRDRIDDICNLSDGLLEKKDFVKNPKVQKSKYEFKPEWHGLLMTLMDTEYFDNRHNDRLLSTRETLYKDLVVNIEIYLENDDKESIKSFPGYLNAKCESLASEAIAFQIQELIRTAMHVDEVVRLRLLKKIHNTLDELIAENNEEYNRIWSTKLVYSHRFDNTEDGELLSALFSADKLPLFIVEMLAYKMKKKVSGMQSKEEQLNYRMLYDQAGIDNPVTLVSESEYEEFTSEINKKSFDNTQFESLMKRIYSVMNMNNPIEKQLYNAFWDMAKIYLIRDKINIEELKKSKKIYEAAFKQDMFDLLNEFANGDWNSPAIKELQRVQNLEEVIRNRIEREKKEE